LTCEKIDIRRRRKKEEEKETGEERKEKEREIINPHSWAVQPFE
jgi:hypothetical protein